VPAPVWLVGGVVDAVWRAVDGELPSVTMAVAGRNSFAPERKKMSPNRGGGEWFAPSSERWVGT
jgi:hypothetical protein